MTTRRRLILADLIGYRVGGVAGLSGVVGAVGRSGLFGSVGLPWGGRLLSSVLTLPLFFLLFF